MHLILTRIASCLRITVCLGLIVSCAPLPPMEIPLPPPGSAPAVVFDVDGTLTPRVSAIFTAREDAARAAQLLAQKGYEIFYLSARHPRFSSGMVDWLRKNDFPDGHVHVAQTREDHRNPAPFKTRQLRAIIGRGWDIVLAYGDSSTDFQAYADAGIAVPGVFALKRKGKAACEPGVWAACLKGWAEHLAFLSTLARNE